MLDFLCKRPPLPASLLHRCFHSNVFPRFFLHTASRSSPPPMLSANSVTCSPSRTSSPHMLSASYFRDFSFIALPVPLLHRCFPQAISRVPLPVPLLQRCVSQAISTIFPPYTFPALFPHFSQPISRPWIGLFDLAELPVVKPNENPSIGDAFKKKWEAKRSR